MARLLEAAPGLKYKAALSVAYGAGLRVSEVAALKIWVQSVRRSAIKWLENQPDCLVAAMHRLDPRGSITRDEWPLWVDVIRSPRSR